MARSRHDNARLRAIEAAHALHEELGTERELKSGQSSDIDIFGIIERLKIPLHIMELDKALGFCLPFPKRGIVVTSQRSLHIQRFTAAHELGHAVLRHGGSVDEKVLMRGGYGRQSTTDIREIEADAFAAEFLLPRWLYIHHMRHQKWTLQTHLQNPDTLYQLSLRLNTSYSATCWGLLNSGLVGKRDFVENLLETPRAKIKATALDIPNIKIGRGNVWVLKEADAGTTISISPEDYIVIYFQENGAAGYEWSDLSQDGSAFDVIDDRYGAAPSEGFGAPVVRRITLKPEKIGTHEILWAQRRPWETHSVNADGAFGLNLNVFGSEKKVLSRARRRLQGLPLS